MYASTIAVKRFLRVIIAYGLAGVITYGLKDLKSYDWYPYIHPILTAGVSFLGKYIREKWHVRVPF